MPRTSRPLGVDVPNPLVRTDKIDAQSTKILERVDGLPEAPANL